jgi:hypothetical protein
MYRLYEFFACFNSFIKYLIKLVGIRLLSHSSIVFSTARSIILFDFL